MTTTAAHSTVRPFRIPVATGVAVAVGCTVLVALADLLTHQTYNLATLYALPLVIAAASMYRRLMWILALVCVVLSFGIFLFRDASDATEPVWRWPFLVNRGITAFTLLLLTAILHGYVGAWRSARHGRELLEQRHRDLESAIGELAQREEEITTQNEELQSQTEELERQSEELRVSNEELARRERTLEVLLGLSRALTAELSREETLERICRTLGEILDHHKVATAILLREGDRLRVACRNGFEDAEAGEEEQALPYARSFAALVLDRDRTGFLEDLALRSDLRTVQSRGPRPFRSILATPLRINGQAVGTLEAYSFEKRGWTDEQIAIIESLAAQTSISLQAAELYDRVQQERTRLQAVLETVPFSVMIANADLSDIRLNPAGAALRRVPPNVNIAPLRDQARWRLFHNGLPLSEDQHPISRAVRYGEIITSREYELVLEGGPRHILLYSAAPIRDQTGRVIGGVVASAEITEQKRLQFELDARRREAEEASARKTRFLAAVSHDIRTPANAISLLAELMQRTATTPALQGEIPQLASDLRSNSLSLVHLVSDVLDLTRFDSGRIELDESEFGLDSLILEECRQLSPLAREKGIDFRCEPPERPVRLRADRVKLARILGNLVSNAVKFTKDGSVTVQAGASREAGVWVCVTDTGPGIAPEFQDRIFDEFFQLKQTAGSSGSGLGLAISRRLAQAMGGTIELCSEPGKGSQFTLRLPASVLVPS